MLNLGVLAWLIKCHFRQEELGLDSEQPGRSPSGCRLQDVAGNEETGPWMRSCCQGKG